MEYQMDIVTKAKTLATYAHEGQYRKYTGEAYINHPKRVVEILQTIEGVTEDMLAAAWLHDVIEDTSYELDFIRAVFGDNIAEMVDGLTKVDGDKPQTEIKLSKTSEQVQTIKLADLLDNTPSIIFHDRDFALSYVPEKQSLIKVMNKGNPVLYKKIYDILYTNF